MKRGGGKIDDYVGGKGRGASRSRDDEIAGSKIIGGRVGRSWTRRYVVDHSAAAFHTVVITLIYLYVVATSGITKDNSVDSRFLLLLLWGEVK